MYQIRLPNFEGPFDLLLYFIKRDEINIYDIPIAKITEEFLSYIRLMQFFDLELAGEFILMASNLMYVKASLLLPRPTEDGDEMIEDPRTLLVERLLEYRKYKEAAEELQSLEEENRYVYYRHLFDADRQTADDESGYKNATLFELLSAFKIAIDRANQVPAEHHVEVVPVTIEEQSEFILSRIAKGERVSFLQIVSNQTVQVVVVTFVALLELIKNSKIYFSQSEAFDDIIIAKRPVLN